MDIVQTVGHALEAEALAHPGEIRASVSNGIVTLEGRVDYLSQYRDAAQCLGRLAGVREVRNLIAVQPSLPRLVPLTVRSAIEHALEHHAEEAARRVHIVVTAGKVTLSGEVPAWSDRNAVEEAVRGTPGVVKVDNKIQLRT
jgi:osmotically-inducible protein OsmY